MILKADCDSWFVFDLDDTLYPEIDYLKSAYWFIAEGIKTDNTKALSDEMVKIYLSGGNAFKFLLEKYPEKIVSCEKLLYLYRNHIPAITLREGVLQMFKEIKKRGGRIGIITDGRSISQRNKIKALGIDSVIDELVISEEFGSEKPSPDLFEYFMVNNPESRFCYFGDNIIKDFISPKKLGWVCIGVLDINNIRKQNIYEFSNEHLPHIFINSFTEIGII
jgi:putative hydrolase of the HAD superfamily